MKRCIELALKGAGSTAPNPMVGAVLVHENRIIGEGFHQQFGGPHAEVNCIRSVRQEDLSFISSSTLYVSLEPCSHYGKTPPCTNLILEKKIPHVVVGCPDPFPEVNGRGIGIMKSAGIQVETGVLEAECMELNKRFIHNVLYQRPFVILKWATTANGMIGSATGERLLISGSVANRLVHRWRSEEAAILVGTNTAMLDNPALDARYWNGASPVRLVIDRQLRLPPTLKIFDQSVPTVVFNSLRDEQHGKIRYYKIDSDTNGVFAVLAALQDLRIQSVLVEGGAQLLQSFIDAGCWNEARVIVNEKLTVSEGVQAPVLKNAQTNGVAELGDDRIHYFIRQNS